LIAVGDKSGKIAIASLSRQHVISSLGVAGRWISRIGISKSWGIVAVAAIGHVDCVTWISTFTIEGELIKEVQMRRPIRVMR
jgi:hypothetical protein